MFCYQQITKAVKLLRANHRLILSGTPVQVCCAHNFPTDLQNCYSTWDDSTNSIMLTVEVPDNLLHNVITFCVLMSSCIFGIVLE